MDFGYNPYQYGQQPYNQYASIGTMARDQNMQQQQMQYGMFGKMIQSQNDIMPGDIPMNGMPCFFPMQDRSAIYMKAWNADGTISTIKFLPEQSAPNEPTQLDRIESMLSSFIGSKEVDDA